MRKKDIKNFNFNIEKIKLLPYLLYSSVTFYIWYKTKFDVIQFVPDFRFYFSYAFRFWSEFNSELAINILEKMNGGIYQGDWQPAPIYPIVFLSPINILGSKLIFAIEGFLVGLGSIFLLRKILSQFNNQINENIKYLSLIIFSISPMMLTNTIALSTNGVWGFFLLIAIAYARNLTILTLSLIMASILRPNFVVIFPIFLICYSKNLIPRTNNIKWSFSIVLASYIFFYLLFHNNYPGDFVNYFLLSNGQGLGEFGEYGDEFISKTLNFNVEFLEANLNLNSILTVLSKPEGINYIFQLFFAKINSLLGYNVEGLYSTRVEDSFWESKILRTFYYFFFLFPGFLISLKKSFYILNNKIKSQNKKIDLFIFSSCFYVLFSSMLIAIPRYLFPFDIVFIIISITYWISNIKLSDEVY